MAGEVADIDTVKQNLLYLIQQFRSVARPPKPDMWYCGELNTASKHYREYAIALLLSEMDSSGFIRNLRESAFRRRELLEWTRDAGVGFQRYTFASNNAPFFDALAAEDLQTARDIAALSAAPFDADYEYEEDYTYSRFLYSMVLNDCRPSPELATMLDTFAADLQGAPSYRLDASRALYECDQDRLTDALFGLIEEHALAYEEEAKGVVADHYRFRTQQYILIEGYALRSIAAQLGLTIDDELRFMPALR